MMNQIILVGRLAKIEEIESENGAKKGVITLAVPQSFKNIDGIYDTNFIDCTLWGAIAENTIEYCTKGDVIGIKGRIQRLSNDKAMELIAEKVTFLSTTRKDEDGEE